MHEIDGVKPNIVYNFVVISIQQDMKLHLFPTNKLTFPLLKLCCLKQFALYITISFVTKFVPHLGLDWSRIDTLRFPAGCRKRLTKHGLD